MHHVLCVAAQEAQANQLADVVTRVPEVLVVGICGPAEAATMVRVVGARLVITPEGTPTVDQDGLSVPVLVIAQGADPVEVVRTYLTVHAGETMPSEEVSSSSRQLPLGVQCAPMRIGLYGTRGGVGTTTAVVAAAQLLAAQGRQVALYDAAKRGDPALLLGLTPSDRSVTMGRITVHPGLPAMDESLRQYDAILIDGGRERRPFPARWIALDKPVPEAELLRMLGLTIAAAAEGDAR